MQLSESKIRRNISIDVSCHWNVTAFAHIKLEKVIEMQNS